MPLSTSNLRPYFAPARVVFFGASPQPGTVGDVVWRNLQHTPWNTRLVAVNPRHPQIGPSPCLADLTAAEGPFDLALVAVPAPALSSVWHACAQTQVKAVLLYGSTEERSAPLPCTGVAMPPLWGSLAMGYALPHEAVNTLAITKTIPKGQLGFISQSNAVCAAVLDWQHNDEFGFSAVLCPGQCQGVDVPELIDYLATDARTEAILLYLESLRHARRFLSAVRAAASVKPVVVVKAGRQTHAQALVQAHLRMPVGNDAAFDAALRRCGALRVDSIGDMFSAARALGHARKPRGKRLAMVGNGGGPLVMAADAAAQHGVELASLHDDTLAALPARAWNAGSAVDLLLDAGAPRYAQVLRALLNDPNVDGVLCLLAPNSFVDPLAVADTTIAASLGSSKPVLGCWMGETGVRPARARLAAARVAHFRTPESAVAGFAFLVNWVRSQAQLQETPSAVARYTPPDVARARSLAQAALAQSRPQLDREEGLALLQAFCIATTVAFGAEADTDIGVQQDAVLGPVLWLRFAHAPTQYALPPLNPRLAQELLERSQAPTERARLHELLLRVAEIATELPSVQRLHLRMGARTGTLVQLQVYLSPAADPDAQYAHMAICPYPHQIGRSHTLRDGLNASIRPIRPEDAAALQAFVRELSTRTKYYRFFNTLVELPQRVLARYTQIDYAREMTLVALVDIDGQSHMVGEANYASLPEPGRCEFAVVVADSMAGKGLGATLMRALMDAARTFGFSHMQGEVLASNEAMLALMETLGFDQRLTDEDMVEVARAL